MLRSVRRVGWLVGLLLVLWAVAVLAPPTYTTYQVTDNLTNDARVDVALDADGTPHAVYVRDGVVYYRKGLGPEVIAGSPSSDTYPAIAVGADRVHIVYNTGTVNPLTYYCRGFDGSVIVNGEEIGTRVSWGDVDVDASGFVHVVYLSDAAADGYADVLYVNNTGGSFGASTLIFDSQDINVTGACHYRWWYDRPAIQMDGDDRYHIVAREHFSEAGCGYGVFHEYHVVYATSRSGGWRDTSEGYSNGLALGRNPLCVDIYLTAGVVFSDGATAYYWRPGTAVERTFATATNPAISLVGYSYEAVIAYEDAILTGQISYVTYDALNNRFLGYTTIGAGSLPAVAAGSLFVYFEKSDGEDSEIYVYTDATLSSGWDIDVSVGPGGGGSVSGGGTYSDGDPVTVTATPATACYEFVSWMEGVQTASTSASYSFTATADRSLVANFRNTEYTISLSASPAEGGTATFPSGEGGGTTYPCSAQVTVSALANAGYEFANWTEGGSWLSNDADYTITVNADRSLVANFTRTQCTLTVDVSPAGGGDVTVEVIQTPSTTTASRAWSSSYPYQAQYAAGTTVRLTALAAEGYEYDEFTGDTGATDPSGVAAKGGGSGSIEVVMDRDRSITGNFKAIPKYTLTLDVAPSGGGDVGATALPKGIVLPFPGHARAGYPIEIDYYEGTRVQVDATASQGFEFKEFTGDLGLTASPAMAAPKGGATGQIEVVMDQDRSITANFSAMVGLFYEDFTDLTGWAATGLWHLRGDQGACFTCGALDGSFAYYARKGVCDYKTGARTAGTLTSPVILLKGAKKVEVTFDYFRHVAAFAQNLFGDATTVQVRLGRGTWRTVWQKSTWNRSPDCGSYATKILTGAATTMQIRFVFDSGNRFYNAFPGWAIDNVKVRDAAGGVSPSSLPPGGPNAGAMLGGLYAFNYPNPVRDIHTTTFTVRGDDVAEIRVWVYDLAGLLVYEDEGPGAGLVWHTDSSGGEYLANGVYLYVVEARIDDEWVRFPLQTIVVLK